VRRRRCARATRTAALPSKPSRLLRDGVAYIEFSWDDAGKRVGVRGFDPRRHVVEVPVREHGLDARGKGIRVEGLAFEGTTGDAVVNTSAASLVDVTVGGKPWRAVP